MFTGIVKGMHPIVAWEKTPGGIHFAVMLPNELLEGLQIGASVALDGACLTVVEINNNKVWFDAIAETLERTTLKNARVGTLLNVERAARFGDEIGGHL